MWCICKFTIHTHDHPTNHQPPTTTPPNRLRLRLRLLHPLPRQLRALGLGAAAPRRRRRQHPLPLELAGGSAFLVLGNLDVYEIPMLYTNSPSYRPHSTRQPPTGTLNRCTSRCSPSSWGTSRWRTSSSTGRRTRPWPWRSSSPTSSSVCRLYALCLLMCLCMCTGVDPRTAGHSDDRCLPHTHTTLLQTQPRPTTVVIVMLNLLIAIVSRVFDRCQARHVP